MRCCRVCEHEATEGIEGISSERSHVFVCLSCIGAFFADIDSDCIVEQREAEGDESSSST